MLPNNLDLIFDPTLGKAVAQRICSVRDIFVENGTHF